MTRSAILAICLFALSACAGAHKDPPADFGAIDILSGGRLPPAQLEKAIAAAARHPLGSAENPVRADMPAGQHEYLARLRCANGAAPRFEREGNVGRGVFGSIVDRYSVACDGGDPAATKVFMDMYHPDYIEAEPVPGFAIMP